jgi:TonB-dependent SusC/RagA subfamily outer membrane receptor
MGNGEWSMNTGYTLHANASYVDVLTFLSHSSYFIFISLVYVIFDPGASIQQSLTKLNYMKRTFIFLISMSLIASVQAGGGDKNIVSSVLKSAMVYRNGAELTHSAKASLNQGNNELVIDNISNRIDINSLQIGSNGNVTILSVEFSTNFLRPEHKLPVVKKLEDSLETVNNELARVQVVLKTDHELLDLLKANKEIRGDQTGVSVVELTKMMDYYKTKTLELQNEISRYKEKELKQLEMIAKINRQIKEEEQKNNKTIGKLLLQLYSPLAGSYDFTISYVTPNAGWNPSYDLRVENINKPVSLAYKAKLVQSTGIDWQQVKLALSTSVPSQHNNAPDVKTWFLAYVNPVGYVSPYYSNRIAGVGAPVAAMEEVKIMGYSSISRDKKQEEQAEPVYVVNGTVMSKAEFSKIDSKAIKNIEVLKDASATAVYGSRASGGAVVVTLKEMGDFVSVKDNQLNVVFDIDLPYDVPSNGKEQNVNLKDYKIPAQYKYYSAPRLDKEAYLLGEIVDWEALNLLPGEANIIFEGTYIGKTSIDAGSVLDTLSLTLGRDKRVVVTRERLADFSSVKFLGTNKKQTFTFEITVRNNKKETVQMELRDQYPVSTNKDIEVELLQHDGASVNGETGILTWKPQLAPGEIKKYRVSYSVKYPKDKAINL